MSLVNNSLSCLGKNIIILLLHNWCPPIKPPRFVKGELNVDLESHLHQKVVPSLIIHINVAGCFNEPHQESLEPFMVLSEAWTGHVSLEQHAKSGSDIKYGVWHLETDILKVKTFIIMLQNKKKSYYVLAFLLSSNEKASKSL